MPAHTSGIYAGWASKGNDPTIYPTALSIGWNPHFKEGQQQEQQKDDQNAQQQQQKHILGKKLSLPITDSHSCDGKTLEPWLLHDFGVGNDFYGEELRLVVCGYIRPEAPFTTVEALVERIYQDAAATKTALGLVNNNIITNTDNATATATTTVFPAAAAASTSSNGNKNSSSKKEQKQTKQQQQEAVAAAAAVAVSAKHAREAMAAAANDPYLRPPGWGLPSVKRLVKIRCFTCVVVFLRVSY